MTSRYFTEAEAEAHQRRVRGLDAKVDAVDIQNFEFVELGMGTMRMNLPVAPQIGLLPARQYAFIFPMPPSVNEAWHNIPTTGGKALTAEHRAFRTNVISRVRAVMRTEAPLAGRIEMHLRLYFANKRRCDIDNRVKPMQDALTHARAYGDDSQVDRLIVERILGVKDEECSVVLREIAA